MERRALIAVAAVAALLVLALLLRSSVAGARAHAGERAYALEENPGGGDCLFYCFASASGRSVRELREAVARSMDAEKLEVLRQIYEEAKRARDLAMLADYGWMRGVRTLPQLRRRVRSRAYFGDDMALPVLERETQLNAVVVKDGAVQRRLDDPLPGRPWVVLLLRDVHYRLVRRGGAAAFARYPEDVVRWAGAR